MKTASENNASSILSIACGLLLVVGGIYALFTYWKKRADVFIIPYGYMGKVTVIYDQATGEAEKYDGKKRIFEIPTNGTLRTRFTNKGNLTEYYYRLPDGTLSQIAQNPNADKFAQPVVVPLGYAMDDTVEIAEINNYLTVKTSDKDSVQAVTFTIARK